MARAIGKSRVLGCYGVSPDPKICRRESCRHGLPPTGKRTCLTFAGNTTAVRLEERVAGHSWGAWELGFLRLFHRENFGSGLGVRGRAN
jgi:hypothetical protein